MVLLHNNSRLEKAIKEDKKCRNTLLALFVVDLFNQNVGFPYLGHICFFLTFFISLRYFFKIMSQRELTLFGILLLFFLFFWGAAWLFSEKVVYQSSSASYRNTTELLTPVINFCFLYFPFYYFGKRGVITTKCIRTFMYIVLVISIVQFFLSYQATISNYSSKFGSSINIGYAFACAMPMLGLLWEDKKRLFFFFMLVAFAFSMLSAKRGAMLCAISSIIIMIIMVVVGDRKKNKGYITNVLIALFFCAAAYFVFSHLVDSNANLQAKMDATEDGKYSGRDVFYLDLLNYWLRADFVSQLFGIKFMGAVELVGFDAHNDWLEIVIDAGLIEAIVYLLMMITLWMFSWRNRKWLLPSEKYVLWSCAVIWLIKSLVSMGFTTVYAKLYLIPIAIVSGIVESRKQKRKLLMI